MLWMPQWAYFISCIGHHVNAVFSGSGPSRRDLRCLRISLIVDELVFATILLSLAGRSGDPLLGLFSGTASSQLIVSSGIHFLVLDRKSVV